jgi:hypothetical protein
MSVQAPAIPPNPVGPLFAARIIAMRSSSEIEPLLSARCASIQKFDARRMHRASFAVILARSRRGQACPP